MSETCDVCGRPCKTDSAGFGMCPACKARIQNHDESMKPKRSLLPTDQNAIIAGFIRGDIKPEDLTPETKCRKCSRPHLPYNPLCGPCEVIAWGAYMEAPAAPDDAPWYTREDGSWWPSRSPG